jgi:hypothetical protein
MGTFTAQILVGQKHPYEGGILNISHMLYLSENDRPAWVLTPVNVFNEKEVIQSKRITWIPTLEHMLEDALLMIGLYVVKDNGLLNLFNQYSLDPNKDFIELYQDVKPENLQKLYKEAKHIISSHKITLSVFQGSSIINQLSVLKEYQNDIEVCQSIYTKEFSPWSKEFESIGDLD